MLVPLLDFGGNLWSYLAGARGIDGNIVFHTSLLISNLFAGIVVSLISVDVWALTILFTLSQKGRDLGAAYAVPLVALLGHFILLIISNATRGAVGPDSQVVNPMALMISLICAIIAFSLALWVRITIWRHYDQPEAV